MKKCSIMLLGVMMYTGHAVAAAPPCVPSLAEQAAKEERAREFLADTSPRATNGHPKAPPNVIDEVYETRTAPEEKKPLTSDYVDETEG